MEPEEYSGFKTLGTDIDEAYSDMLEIEVDADDVEKDSYDDRD